MSMSNFLLALLIVVQDPPSRPVAEIPDEWAAYAEVDPAVTTGITYEVTLPVIELHRRPGCRVPSLGRDWRGVRVEVALLVASDRRILDVETHSGACRRIRDYAAAILRRTYDGKLAPTGPGSPQWQRAHISFSWQD